MSLNRVISPRFSAYNLQMPENHNSLLGAKANIKSSPRKPLADKAINSIKPTAKLSNQQMSTAGQSKSKLPEERRLADDYPPWYFDVFAYSVKEFDDYEDILHKELRFDDYKCVNLHRSGTPPPKIEMEIHPMEINVLEPSFDILEKPVIDFKPIQVKLPDFDSIFKKYV